MLNHSRFLGAALISSLLLVALYLWAERQVVQGLDNVAVANSEKANESVTTILATNVVGPFMRENGSAVFRQPLQGATYDSLDSRIGAFLAGTYTRKVKLINTQGLIVYSTDRPDLGEDYSGSDAVIRATELHVMPARK